MQQIEFSNRGRPPKGSNSEKFVKYNITLSPDIVKRLDVFMTKEERGRSWTIQKALDEYLTKRNY